MAQHAGFDLPENSPSSPKGHSNGVHNSEGWDGKLRIDSQEYSDDTDEKGEKAVSEQGDSGDEVKNQKIEVIPPEEIVADEDLLDDYEDDADDIDLVHCRVTSIPALHLERFSKLEKLCLRQNHITHIEFPSSIGSTLENLDLYDNLITHTRGLENLSRLTSLDLSFNKIKHIKGISHMTGIRDLYFVQNKIRKIENLEGLSKLRNLELAANKIRDIENISHLTALEELWLGRNKITDISPLPSLPNLRILSLPSNRLTTLAPIPPLPRLEELYISHNAITCIPPDALKDLPNLHILDITSNRIAHLENLSHLSHLEELWASSNQLASFEEVEKELRNLKGLKTVYFEGNPLQSKAPALYRNKVRLALPQVIQIDATYVKI